MSGFHCTGGAITIVEPPLYGTILQTYPNFYRLDPEAALPPTPFDETFRYEICDFDGLCSQAQATIHVVATPVPVAAPACDDGLDGDGDGLVDFPHDPGCPAPHSHPENPECDDGIDNDGDGLTDFGDAKCNPSWPYWEHRPTCGLGAELALALPILAALRRRARSARVARAQLSLFD